MKTTVGDIDKRREVVADFRAKGYTVRQIHAMLELRGVVNPKTGEAYSVATIGRDVKHVTDEWRERAMQAISDHKARQLHEIAVLKREAWLAGDRGTVIKALRIETQILGTNAPLELDAKVTGTWQDFVEAARRDDPT